MPFELRRGERGIVRVGHRGAAALAPGEQPRCDRGCGARSAWTRSRSTCCVVTDGMLVLGHGPAVPADAPLLDEALELVARLGFAVQLDVKIAAADVAIVAALRRHDLLVAGVRELVLAADPARLRRCGAGAAAVVDVSGGSPRRVQRRLLSPAVRAALASCAYWHRGVCRPGCGRQMSRPRPSTGRSPHRLPSPPATRAGRRSTSGP